MSQTAGLLQGKRYVIFGVANHKSLAWAISQQLHAAGAQLAFNFLGENLERRVRPLAEEVKSPYVANCNVSNDQDIQQFYAGLSKVWDRIDGVVHSVAFANGEDLHGGFSSVSRAGYAQALDISAYSLNAIVRPAIPMMSQGGAVVALTYYGSSKVIKGYHVMGVAKAALECGVRYLAAELGEKNIRVNAISAGPVRTLAASGIKGFRGILDVVAANAPLRRNILPEEVGKSALYLMSDLASGVTGEVHYVDCGINHLGLANPQGESTVASNAPAAE